VIEGRYGKGGDLELPRVVTISISRYERRLPKPHEPLGFLVRFHEEGTPITWQRDIVVESDAEQHLVADVAVLDTWTTGEGGTPAEALRVAEQLGDRLFETFLGRDGRAFLDGHPPTALMIDVDETILSLPWELLRDDQGLLAERHPFGRIVSTRTVPRPERDPLREDRELHVLAVLNPTGDIAYMHRELDAIRSMEGARLRLEVLEGDAATRGALAEAVRPGTVDLLHFSGHGGFDERTPSRSGLALADGELTTTDILALPWAQPPYMVFNSACWSGRAASGHRLVHQGARGNGVAAAFLGAGTSAFAGWFWPVSMRSATAFVSSFYGGILQLGSIGEAFRHARSEVLAEFGPSADLGGHGALLYGDAGTGQRRDLQSAS
jgi:hypothetical protein